MTRDEAQAECILAWSLATATAVRVALNQLTQHPGQDLCGLLCHYQKLSVSQADQVRRAIEFEVRSGRLKLTESQASLPEPSDLVGKTNDLIETFRVDSKRGPAPSGDRISGPPRRPPPMRRGSRVGRSAESIAADSQVQDRLETVRLEKGRVVEEEDEAPVANDTVLESGQVAGRYMSFRFGRFQVLGEIASGAMGILLRAWHLNKKKVVALKLLLSENQGDSNLFARFRREAKVLEKLEHPHIVRVVDHGYELDEQPYLAMEFIVGKTLKQLVFQHIKQRGRSPDAAWVCLTVLPIARALQYCHEAGVIHRDVKPTNIVVESSSGRPVLVDFGLVKRDASRMQTSVFASLSRAGEILGTPAYMSPEQVTAIETGVEVTPASDVWGLGATLVFALTGQTPYGESSAMATYLALISRAPRRLKEIDAAQPRWLDELCAECLQRAPHLRPSLDEVIARLERGA